MSSIHFKRVVSSQLCIALSCVLFHEEYLWLHFISIDLNSSLNILGFPFFIRGVVLMCYECLLNIGMLAFVGFVAGIAFRAASAQCVACFKSSSLAIFLPGLWAIGVLTCRLSSLRCVKRQSHIVADVLAHWSQCVIVVDLTITDDCVLVWSMRFQGWLVSLCRVFVVRCWIEWQLLFPVNLIFLKIYP